MSVLVLLSSIIACQFFLPRTTAAPSAKPSSPSSCLKTWSSTSTSSPQVALVLFGCFLCGQTQASGALFLLGDGDVMELFGGITSKSDAMVGFFVFLASLWPIAFGFLFFFLGWHVMRLKKTGWTAVCQLPLNVDNIWSAPCAQCKPQFKVLHVSRSGLRESVLMGSMKWMTSVSFDCCDCKSQRMQTSLHRHAALEERFVSRCNMLRSAQCGQSFLNITPIVSFNVVEHHSWRRKA